MKFNKGEFIIVSCYASSLTNENFPIFNLLEMNCVVSKCIYILLVKVKSIELNFLIHVNEKIDGWRYGINICFRLPRTRFMVCYWLIKSLYVLLKRIIYCEATHASQVHICFRSGWNFETWCSTFCVLFS